MPQALDYAEMLAGIRELLHRGGYTMEGESPKDWYPPRG